MSVLRTVHAGMYIFGCGLRPNDPLFGETSVVSFFAVGVGIDGAFIPRSDGGDGDDFGEALAVALDSDRPEEERFILPHSLFLLVSAIFEFARDFSPFLDVPNFCEKIPVRDCNIMFLDLIGPRHITAGSVGMYDDKAIGRETIRIEEKLSNPASTFTSSTSSGIIRSHSLNRSVESSLGRKVSLIRTAKSNLGTRSSNDVICRSAVIESACTGTLETVSIPVR